LSLSASRPNIPVDGDATKLRTGVSGRLYQPEIGEHDRHLGGPRIARSGTMPRVFLGELPLRFPLGPDRRADHADERQYAHR
jgi:hypothetical protein